jgi:hypothetical protein
VSPHILAHGRTIGRLRCGRKPTINALLTRRRFAGEYRRRVWRAGSELGRP